MKTKKPCTTISRPNAWVWCLLCGVVEAFKTPVFDHDARVKRWVKKHTCRENK